jgi:hypothetical protein
MGPHAITDLQQVLIAIGFFILFALPPLLSQFKLGRRAEADDIALILLDGLAAFVAVVNATGGFGGQYVGLVSLILAAVYMGFSDIQSRKFYDLLYYEDLNTLHIALFLV